MVYYNCDKLWASRKATCQGPTRAMLAAAPDTLFIKLFLSFLFLLLLSTPISASAQAGARADEESWTLIQTVDKVNFYYRASQCHGHSFLLLKAVNENATTVHGFWEIKARSGEKTRMYVGVLRPLAAGQAQAGSCERPDPDMVIPMMNVDPASLQFSVTARITRK
jgi:hypothetical protein